jgi:hypothetical protein
LQAETAKKAAPKAKAPAKKEKKAPAKAKVRVSCTASIVYPCLCFDCEASCRLSLCILQMA